MPLEKKNISAPPNNTPRSLTSKQILVLRQKIAAAGNKKRKDESSSSEQAYPKKVKTERVSTLPSISESNTTPTLDPTLFENWTKEEVCSLLCSAKGKGGAGLTETKVQPLYDAGFDGNSLANIISTIKEYGKKDAVDETCKSFPEVARDTIKTVVNWVEKEILIPLKRDDDLLQQIGELSDENAEQCKALYIQAYDTLLKEKLSRRLEMSDWPNFKEELMNSTTIPDPNVIFGFPDFGKEFRACELPLFGDGKFAKHELPYFSQFHYSMEKDKELLAKLELEQKSSIMLMGPSGIGKTSAAIRLLCKNAGMILTCTDFDEKTSGLTTDSLMKHMHSYLSSQNLYRLYGCVRQVTQIAIICRLIYILKLIQNAKSNPSVFTTFGGIQPYLAFMQSNGKTSSSIAAFNKFVEFDLTSTHTLINIAWELTNEIIASLNDNSAAFGMKTPCKHFLVVVDEANVYARLNDNSKLSHLIGLNGKKRGLLTILTQVIAENDIFHMSLFCGTNFSVDMGSIIQSALGKTEAKINIEKYYDFGLVAREDLLSFLRQHIKITQHQQSYLEDYLYQNDYKYFRRRIITLALEELEKIKDNNGQLVTAFEKSIDIGLQYTCDAMVKNYLKAYTSITTSKRPCLTNHLQLGITDALVNYIAHYQFPFLGSDFTVEHNDVADALLYSAFSGPERCTNNIFTFSSKDFLGVEIAYILLYLINNKKTYTKSELPRLSDQEKEHVMKYVISSKIKLILKSNHSIDMESIMLLRLAELNGLELQKIAFLAQLTEKHTNLKIHKFKSIYFLNPKGYLTYCKKKDIDISKCKDGEMLYWTHFSEKNWDLLDGVFLTLSNFNHSEFFGINKVKEDDEVKIITFAVQSKVQSGKKFDIHEPFKSTVHQLFYMDKISRQATKYGEIRDAVQQVFTDCAYSFHLCIGLHPTFTFPSEQKQNYSQNYLCAFIDKENHQQLFGEAHSKELNDFITRCAGRIDQNNKQ